MDESNKPTDEKITETTVSVSNTPVSEESNNVCPSCGAALEKGVKFCPSCGATVGVKFCANCGSNVNSGDKFCKKCGAEIGKSSAAPNTPQPTAAPINNGVAALRDVELPLPSEDDLKRRKIGFLITMVFALIAAVGGIVFIATPLLSVVANYGGEIALRISESGFAVIGTLFSGKSALSGCGVEIEDLRFAGWTYLTYIVLSLLIGGCVYASWRRRERCKPYGILTVSILLAVLGILALAFNIECMSLAKQHSAAYIPEYTGGDVSVSCYLGGIGVFICSIVGLIGVIVGRVYARKTFVKARRSKTKERSVIKGLSIAAGVIMGIMFFIPVFVTDTVEELPVTPNTDGYAATSMDVEITVGRDVYYVGMTVFRLRALNKNARYTFTVEFDEYISADNLEDTVVLCYYDEVHGQSPKVLVYDVDILEGNQYVTTSKTSITFYPYDYDGELAIVVNFMAVARSNISYKYALSERI